MDATHLDQLRSGIIEPRTPGDRPQPTRSRTLDRLAAQVPEIQGIWKREVCAGDWLIVHTRNSRYILAAQGDGTFAVTGGWFDITGAAGAMVGIAGCTWGGQAILTTIVAAPGMFLEFDNGVRTTRIQQVRMLRGATGHKPN